MSTRSIPFRVISVVLSVLIFLCSAPSGFAQGSIQVPAGTMVQLRLSETVSPETKGVGDSVSLTAMNDVIVKDKVVISAGASATGEVTVSEKKGAVGSPAKIGISIVSVNAVDGKAIPLRASKTTEGKSNMATAIVVAILCCILGLLIQGGDASLEEGAIIDCQTTVPVNIDVR